MNTSPWFITAARAQAIRIALLAALLAAAAPKVWAVTEVFTAPGTYTWTAPAGVTSVTVAVWGAGGGGGDPAGNNGGGGGGAGAYASSVVTVVPGNSYSYTVGAGGVEATNGGSSSFGTTTVVAAGGSGTSTAAAGAGGTIAASTGTTKYAGCAGGTGQNGNNKPGGGGGGSPTSSGICTAGGNASASAGGTSGTGDGAGGAGSSTASNGSNGSQPGGGGGGASDIDGSNAGNGGNGKIQLTYNPCTCVPQNGNLIANPDFEELCATTIVQNFGPVNGGTVNMRNGVCGWTMNGTGMETWENTTTTPASKGTVFVEIDGYSTTVDCLSQNVATTPGIAYTLKVDYRARTTTLEGLIVKWNGAEKYSTTAAPTSAWQTITVSGLTATGNDRIEFCEPTASNNSFGSWIDNVRLQAFFPDHYEVSVPSSNVACLASTVKVTVCADSSSPCTNPLAVPATTTASLGTSAGTLASGTLAFGASGIVTTTLSYPAAADGATATLTLSGESVPGANPRTCCIGNTCSTANTCAVTFNTAGFIVSSTAGGTAATIPAQVAGTTSSSFYLRAIKSNTTTQACESALVGAQSVNWAAQCNNPTTCSTGSLMSLTGNATTAAGSNPIASNPNAGVSSTTLVNMTFDANGSAPFSFNYSDVGQVTLLASKAAGGSLLSALAASSNAFVVKPGGFAVSASSIKQTASPQLTNPAALDATGDKFVKAGEAFTATVSAVTSGGAATPNFGRETVPEGVTLAANLVAPGGGNAPALTNGAIAGGSFGGTGSATVTTLAWSEVGIITLTPSLTDGDYLGAGNVTGTTTGNIGRFYPDHFVVTQGSATPACSNVFSYFGQDGFATAFTLTAQNVGNSTTQNYTGSFAKLGLTTWSNFRFVAAGLPTGSVLAASTTAPIGTWGAGTASVTARHQVSRPTTLVGLATNTAVSVLAAPVDSDNVTMTAAQVAASTPLRYGRLRLQNAYGSELLALPVTATTEYRDASGYYVKNTDDSCTTVAVPAAGSGLTFGAGNLSAGETVAGINGTSSGLGTWVSGNGGLVLSRPGSGNNGFVDITLSVPDWLKFPWSGGSPVNPTAKAVFGIFKSPLIYRRENY